MALLPQIAADCRENHVALIDKESLALIGVELRKLPGKRLLEIGSGYGYSALSFLLALLEDGSEGIAITTIERMQARWERVKHYVSLAGAEDFICCMLGEAPEAFSYLNLTEQWDCIFMDAAMGRYGDFWQQLKDSLSPGGIFIADNINLHGVLDKTPEELPRRHRTMEKRLKAFLQMIDETDGWFYERYDYGEGLLIVRRCADEHTVPEKESTKECRGKV